MNSSIALKTITATPHLLTTFTPPTSCWESLYYPTITQGLAAYQPGDDFHPADIYPFLDASCYPPGHTYSPGYTSTNPDGLKTFYTYAWLYSPGLFCPWGYTTPSNGFETTVGLTLTFCCPSYVASVHLATGPELSHAESVTEITNGKGRLTCALARAPSGRGSARRALQPSPS